MAGKVQHRVGEQRLVAVGLRNQGARVVGDDELGHAAKERQRASGAVQPVSRCLARCGQREAVAGRRHGGHEDVGAPDLLPVLHQGDGGASVVDEHLLASVVGLAHGALEAFGKLSVVLAELGVAQGFEGGVRTVFIADLSAVFLPQQHDGDAFAAQLLVHAPVVRAGIVGGQGGAEQSVLQIGLAHGLDGRPVKTGRRRQGAVFGDAAFGDAKGGGYFLVALSTNEFETQGVFEFAHVDPGCGHEAPDKLSKATGPPS